MPRASHDPANRRVCHRVTPFVGRFARPARLTINRRRRTGVRSLPCLAPRLLRQLEKLLRRERAPVQGILPDAAQLVGRYDQQARRSDGAQILSIYLVDPPGTALLVAEDLGVARGGRRTFVRLRRARRARRTGKALGRDGACDSNQRLVWVGRRDG